MPGTHWNVKIIQIPSLALHLLSLNLSFLCFFGHETLR